MEKESKLVQNWRLHHSSLLTPGLQMESLQRDGRRSRRGGRPGLEILFISGTALRAKKNQGAKKTRSKTRGKGKRKEKGEEGKEGVKQTVFWLPRFTNFWLSNHMNRLEEKERQLFWLSKSIISEPKKGWKGSLRRKKK